MTQLLVSVRSAAEARIAMDAGVDFIDVKEPLNGSLGAASQAVIEQVCTTVSAGRTTVSPDTPWPVAALPDGSMSVAKPTNSERWERRPATECPATIGAAAIALPVSVALGELCERESFPKLVNTNVTYAKIGLAGEADNAHWRVECASAFDSLPRGINRVAVIYADFANALSPSPGEIISFAVEQQYAAVLIDTFDKTRGGVLTVLPDLAHLVEQINSAGLMSVVGGSLRIADVASVLQMRPNVIAVRGAVCDGDRAGDICPDRTRALAEQLKLVSDTFSASSSTSHIRPV